MDRTIVILGSHPGTKDLAPLDQETWVFNEAVGFEKERRVDGVFQMHQEAIWKNPKNSNDPRHYEWLRQAHDFPIWMLEASEDIPASVKYPLEEICEEILPGFTKGDAQVWYFTSSVAYALAMAIYLQYSKIEIYGVEMETNTEYAYQRDGVFFWLGVALGRGIQVRLCAESGLFGDPLYGYDGQATLRLEDFEERLEQLRKGFEPAKARAQQAIMQLEAALEMLSNATDGDLIELAQQSAVQAVKDQAHLVTTLGGIEGGMQQLQAFIGKAGAMDEAAGEHIFSRQEYEHNAALTDVMAMKSKTILDNLGGQATLKFKSFRNSRNGNKDALLKDYREAHKRYLQAAYEYGKMLGINQENLRCLEKHDRLMRALGGEKAVRAVSGIEEAV